MAFGRVDSPFLEAPPPLTVSHLTRAAVKAGRSPKIRSSKPEGRKKAETRNPRMAGSDGLSLRGDGCGFGNSAFALLSAFGLRVSALDWTEPRLEYPRTPLLRRRLVEAQPVSYRLKLNLIPIPPFHSKAVVGLTSRIGPNSAKNSKPSCPHR